MIRSHRLLFVLAALALAAWLAAAAPAQEGNPRLSKRERLGLPAREADLCNKCHEGYTGPARPEEAFVHAPVLEGRCFDCHEAHAGRHGLLLRSAQEQLCSGCHPAIAVIPESQEAHDPVAKGQCAACHDPHRSALEFGLPAEGAELCGTCHEDHLLLSQNEEINQHMPFGEGECLLCHSPHAGTGGANLLMPTGELCESCHDLEDEGLKASHLGAEVAKLDCMSCHTPHATSSDFLVHEFAHEPFGGGSCDMCHDDAADDPRTLLAEAPDLCFSCHDDVADVKGAVSVHAPAEAGMCLECHTPHASPRSGLVKGLARDTCLACHEDVRTRAEASVSSHLKHDNGNCAGCHEPHASLQPTLMRAAGLAACMGSHASPAQCAQPMGDSDHGTRTGTPLHGMSCPDPQGTEFAYSLRAEPVRDLCIGCHDTVGSDG
ncbi:MAG: hypothetical protein H8E31_10570 [Planctomycetes bacterium]|nr:hypothetical protein [Planctomycetota bacterium]